MSTDKLVQELLKLVAEKKSKIKTTERSDWKTNCQFSYFPDTAQRVNLQVVDLEQLLGIAGFLTSIRAGFDEAARLLDSKTKFSWMGKSYDDWMHDIRNRINKLELTKNKKDLELLEARLDKLISPELRTQMELEEITQLLHDR